MLVDAIYTGSSTGAKVYRFPSEKPMTFSSVNNRRTVDLEYFERMSAEWPHDFLAVPVDHPVPPMNTPTIHLGTVNDYNKEVLLGMDLSTIGMVLAARRYAEEALGTKGYSAVHNEVLGCDPFVFKVVDGG